MIRYFHSFGFENWIHGREKEKEVNCVVNDFYGSFVMFLLLLLKLEYYFMWGYLYVDFSAGILKKLFYCFIYC